ncbi:hypothetical protein AB751O23_AO_00030 [Chlamydiales bacterium SCGC AB-751-O23]|jgi:hypothetical protein|nr:hypothetical protein AB751O23_AO_00030 [Chlamydiales bacterium SCGC AB-751-O23]
MKKIAIIFQDVGATLQLVPISQGFQGKNMDILNLCSKRCGPILESRGLRFTELLRRGNKADSLKEVHKQIVSFSPDIVLIGNSSQKNNLDQLVMEVSKSLDIPCCQFVDFWGEIRVSPPFPDAYITFDEIGYYSLTQRELTPVYCVDSPKHYEYCKLDLAALRSLFFMKFPFLKSKIITSVFLQSEIYLPGHLKTISNFVEKIKEKLQGRAHKLLIKSHPSYPEDLERLKVKLSALNIEFVDVSDIPIEEVFSVTRYAASCLSTCTIDFRYFCEYLGHEGIGIFLTFHPLISQWLDRLGLKNRKEQITLSKNFYFLENLDDFDLSRHTPLKGEGTLLQTQTILPVHQVYEVLKSFLIKRKERAEKPSLHLL